MQAHVTATQRGRNAESCFAAEEVCISVPMSLNSDATAGLRTALRHGCGSVKTLLANVVSAQNSSDVGTEAHVKQGRNSCAFAELSVRRRE